MIDVDIKKENRGKVMKKVLAGTVTVALFLGGCSQLDPYLEKIPFLSNSEPTSVDEPVEKEEDNQQETENNPTEQPPEQDEQNEDDLTLASQFFNQIEDVDGKPTIANPTNLMVMVNKDFALPADYAPEDLVRADVEYSFGDQDIEKSYLRKEAADALEELFSAAKKEKIALFAVSGYRSYDRQEAVFQAEVNSVGEEKASEAVALPGSSEHQTGLAMDISSPSVDYTLTQDYEDTTEGKWLKENAHKYGFILRYPKGKEEITGYKFEPWHFRYVGKEAAKVIFEKDLTLEEYFESVKEI